MNTDKLVPAAQSDADTPLPWVMPGVRNVVDNMTVAF